MGKLLDSIQRAGSAIHGYRRKNFRDRLPLKGYEEERNEIKFVDLLRDSDLIELNSILNWNCFTVDRHGRRFGNAAWQGKRSEPEVFRTDEFCCSMNNLTSQQNMSWKSVVSKESIRSDSANMQKR